MNKLSLKIDDLQVESFSTSSSDNARGGTVFGHASTPQTNCCPTDALRTPCCWTSGTDAGGSELGNCDSFYCGSGEPGGGGTGQSCVGDWCSIDFCNTDDPHKCYDHI